LDYFTDDSFLEGVRSKGQLIRERLETIVQASPDAGWQVRGRGMIQGLDTGDGAFAKRVQKEAFDRGLLIGPCGTGGSVLKVIPPLIIGDEDLAEGLDLLQDAIRAAQ